MMNKRRIFFLMTVLVISSAVGCGKIYLSLNVGGEGEKFYTNDSEYTEKTCLKQWRSDGRLRK